MSRKLMQVKLEILEQGKTQADVATESGIHRSRLSDICNGRIRPNTDEPLKLAAVLGKNEADLFTWQPRAYA